MTTTCLSHGRYARRIKPVLSINASVFCICSDLIDDATLERTGTLAGCFRQAVHKLAVEFRETTGLQA